MFGAASASRRFYSQLSSNLCEVLDRNKPHGFQPQQQAGAPPRGADLDPVIQEQPASFQGEKAGLDAVGPLESENPNSHLWKTLKFLEIVTNLREQPYPIL